ncbi:MAG: protein O-GlcNAc transferase [Acidobacteriota bacterium]|jgi:hypothetical protein|nr:protein O-GlcNAc transferase [Acidobacteriota bacterium]
MLLIMPVVLALVFSWYATRWYMGDFVAEFAPNMDEGQMEAAMAAMRLAPDDPWTHWVVAGLKRKSFLPEDLQEAVHQYEEAARLSPNDYRFWLDLGRAREAAGDRDGGEKALRRAVELAPSYAYPRWYLGNLLLRSGQIDEAFAELRRAAEADARLRPGLFNSAWTLYSQDVEQIRKVVGDSAAARGEFISYLVGRQRMPDALNLWTTFTPAEKKEQSTIGNGLAQSLIEQKHYHTAWGILREIGPDDGSTRTTQFVNGGFESDIDTAKTSLLNWRVKSDTQAQIAIDGSMRHGGERSLRILFRSSQAMPFDNVSQLVVVEPATQYRFECYVRAEDLKSGGTPLIYITDAMDGTTSLGSSEPLPAGTYDWQLVSINFKTSPKTEAVTVTIGRSMCGGAAVCPIFGKVWYDDFNLQSAGGTVSPRDAASGNKTRG